jgi:hypothetical protein
MGNQQDRCDQKGTRNCGAVRHPTLESIQEGWETRLNSASPTPHIGINRIISGTALPLSEFLVF